MASEATRGKSEPNAAPWFDATRVLVFAPGSYARVHALQRELLEARIAGRGGDVLLAGEHEAVVTLGRGTKETPAALAVPVVAIERGGQATWHGPGQLVVYPILSLVAMKRSVRDYLRGLEQALIETAGAFGLSAGRREGATGVWVGERKLASIGVAVRRFITWHGVALNVDPDLAGFASIRPCGFEPSVMTSLRRELGCAPPMEEVRHRLVLEIVREFRLAPPIWETAAA